MKKISILFLVCSFLSGIAIAQTNDSKEALYNIGFGSVFGGIGAVINKKKNEKLNKVFLKGMGQGALGGYLVFESKRLIRQFDQKRNYNYIWPSRLLNSAGNSIMENAAGNLNFWEKWHINLGFNRIELLTKNGFKVNYRFMPLSFVRFISVWTKEGALDVSTSLRSGLFIFKRNGFFNIRGVNEDIEAIGVARGNYIVISNLAVDKFNILAHEIIHVYQNEGFVVFNPYLDKTINNIWPDRSLDKGIWNILYLDLNTFYFPASYSVDARIRNNYNKRFFEQEAFYYVRD